MRLLVLLLSLSMPVIAWFDQRRAFGPTNGEVSNSYPTLLVAAGYAFSIWGLIFLLDVLHALMQASGRRRALPSLSRAAPWTALGFAATAVWMPLFSGGHYALCVLVIAAATAGMVQASRIVLADPDVPALSRWALPLHAGWLTLASFLNLAQAIVAYRWLPTGDMLGWSLVLLVLATVALLLVNARLRSLPYAAAAVWGLVAAWVRQHDSTLPGANVTAVAALVAAALVVAQLLVAGRRRRRH
ncbi:MAG TPA: hypothetical protein VIG88_10665 [Lysobacter sp.]